MAMFEGAVVARSEPCASATDAFAGRPATGWPAEGAKRERHMPIMRSPAADAGAVRDRLEALLEPVLAQIASDDDLREALSTLPPPEIVRLVQNSLDGGLSRLASARTPGSSVTIGGLAPWQVRRTTEYLERNLDRDISLADVARVARLSQFHFARAFKRSVGQSPHAYLVGLRITRAKELLVSTERSITDIAGDVGYDTPQSLARVFSRGVGVTPSEYRRSHGRGVS